ncbi:T9SS-dependent choice-of-anchor J family protein [Aridibaculum aurantiacum]|uniref:T9SS-dependent choice-of-anchor J family protein n=1 Tax=Aridibaculum aurantiacum TaxID=2810307 RepID=UPI001A9757DD|nr:choice-of-anchor J domain-containing protein [Aridibaculum aurantiacum]
MKKFTLLTFLFILSFFQVVIGQKQEVKTPVIRCATMDAIDQRLSIDPKFRALIEAGQRQYEESKQSSGMASRTSTLTGPVTIPVVVHVVLPNPHVITDADIDYFLNRLNLDFSGLNPDSANGAPFYGVRGHSLIRFTRARRDPNGNITNGVQRRTGAIAVAGSTYQPVKHTSDGGLDPWDVTRYYNLWVCGTGALNILGIAPAIGPGNATETTGSSVGIDGVVVDYRAFANSCFADPAFNRARTAVHEIGHNFGLYHTFQGNCSSADFQQLTTPNCQLPSSLLAAADDTPAENGPQYGCPSTAQASGCAGSPNPPGRMYQNFMNYTDDACMTMFTKGQVERMHYLLEICRAGYLTTNGHIPPANVPALDAAPTSVVNPGGSEFNPTTCQSINYPSLTCPGNVAPRVRIENRGTTTLTSVRVGFSLNGIAQPEQTVTVNIPFGNSAVVAFPSIAIPAGNQVLKFWTSQPNGSADQQQGNDTLTINLSVGVGVSLPLVENFSSATFPPNGWTRVRVAGTTTAAPWDRSTATASGPAGSARANFWNIGTGNKIDLRSPLVSVQGYDSVFVSFAVAHRQYNNVQDTLQLWVSPDCGATFIKLWEQWSSQLATTNPQSGTTELINPGGGDWKTITVSLPSANAQNILNNQNLMFAWRAASNFGNNIFLDDINITGKVSLTRDIQPTNFVAPAAILCSGNNITPAVMVRNNGVTTITSFNVNYQVNGGTTTVVNWTGSLGKDSTVRVNLNLANFTPGTYAIKAWTSNPNNLPDQLPMNDTTNYTFVVETITNAPMVEGFEGTTFPPANWRITQQPVDDTTWTRTTTAGRNSTASAFMNNFRYTTRGKIDNLLTPVMAYTGADSVFLKFDVAAATKTFPGSTATPLDTLEVLVSTDCGATFRSIYKKWGHELQTVGDPNFPTNESFVPRANSHWRRDSINVTTLLGSNNTVRFAFRNTNNFENNIYIDNVNFTPKTLSQRIKTEGFMITPSPFRNDFTIQHYLAPTSLTGYGVYNSVGQQVVARSFANGTADSYINVNMSHLPAGVYTIKLIYTNRTISQKIVKVN